MRQIAGVHANAGVGYGGVAEYAATLELGNQLVHLGGAEEEIDLGEMIEELLLVTLDHAPDGHHGLTRPVFLETSRLDQRIDGLFLRGIDEAAGIDDDDLRRREVADGLGAPSDEARKVALAIDSVLVAAQSDEADSHSEKLVARGTGLNDSRSRLLAIIAELQLDAEVLSPQQRHHRLKLVLGR